jgi:hypothetical protein
MFNYNESFMFFFLFIMIEEFKVDLHDFWKSFKFKKNSLIEIYFDNFCWNDLFLCLSTNYVNFIGFSSLSEY